VRNKLIIALDVDTPSKALALVKQLRATTGMFKVFLDLKFHDIPHQVAGAARAAAELGVSLFTVHASGGSEMIKRAVDSVTEVAAKTGRRSAVLAISVLTSVDATILSQIGITSTPAESVLRLVRLAEAAGVDGVVASPHEIENIRGTISNAAFLIVTPGIRPSENEPAQEDQKRVATPAAAITAGASYLVVGRPITGASDPLKAAEAIVVEMKRAEAL
jgi:orotidine-5'-phosphate decarboxylase